MLPRYWLNARAERIYNGSARGFLVLHEEIFRLNLDYPIDCSQNLIKRVTLILLAEEENLK
jgi:hypothetical protein